MRTTWLTSVVVAVAGFAGYMAGAVPVKAQGEALPFQVGDTIVVTFQGGGSRHCYVGEIRGTFARCGRAADRNVPSIARREAPDEWVNVAVVEWVTKPQVQQ